MPKNNKPTKKMVLRAEGGTNERRVPLDEIQIPDVWTLAQDLKKDPNYTPTSGEAVEELWHLCHDLKKALARQ